jgi:hypothetical protein
MGSDTTRGLMIGLFVGGFGGLMISAATVGMVREYMAAGGIRDFIVDYGQPLGVVVGIVIGSVVAYRMLQNLPQDREEEQP